MKIKFTKRSQKDKTLVTVSLAQFDNTDLDFCRGACDVGGDLVLVIEGVPTLFTLCRPDSGGTPTAATTRCFPRHLRLPTVGRPLNFDVSEAR